MVLREKHPIGSYRAPGRRERARRHRQSRGGRTTQRVKADPNVPKSERKRSDAKDLCVYLNMSESKNPAHKGRGYIGKSDDWYYRWRQHNGEVGGGAWKTVKMRPWRHVLRVRGFRDASDAFSFEWHAQQIRAGRRPKDWEQQLVAAGLSALLPDAKCLELRKLLMHFAAVRDGRPELELVLP